MKKLHPLSLIFLALWFSSAAVFVLRLEWLGIALLLAFLCNLLYFGFSGKTWLRPVVRMLPLFLAVLLIQALFVKKGSLVWGRGWYGIYSAGLQGGVAFCLRLLILFFSARLLLKLDYEDFDAAFHAVQLPEELGFMVFYTIHVLPWAGDRISHNRQLLRLRGVELSELPWRQKLRIYQRISLSLLADLLSRSSVQAIALELRGFRSGGQRTRLHKRSFSWPDALALAFIATFTAAFFIF